MFFINFAFFFSPFRKQEAAQIRLNLVTALAVAQIAFLSGINATEEMVSHKETLPLSLIFHSLVFFLLFVPHSLNSPRILSQSSEQLKRLHIQLKLVEPNLNGLESNTGITGSHDGAAHRFN